MSYQSDVAYQQRGPPVNRGGGNYYYGGDDSYRNAIREDPYHRRDERQDIGLSSQDYQPRQAVQRYEPREEYNRYDEQLHERPQDYQRQNGDYHNQHNAAPPTKHRYPQTFQGDLHQPAARAPPWEQRAGSKLDRGNDPRHVDRSYGNTSYGNQTNYDYQDPRMQRHPQSPKAPQSYNDRVGFSASDRHQPYEHDNRGRSHQFRPQNEGSYARSNEQPHSLHWSDQNRNDRIQPRDDFDRQRPAEVSEQQDYRQNQSRRDLSPPSQRAGQDNPPQPQYQPNAYEQGRDAGFAYNQRDQPVSKRFHDSYRDDTYRDNLPREIKSPPEPPQVLAKTSGSTAVFGIVARVDTSPTRRNAPVLSPTETNGPTPNSPVRSYGRPYDQYNDNEPAQEQPPLQSTQQQHRYHHALTPISEKPSPPSSIGSRGHAQDQNWPTKSATDFQSQYRPQERSDQPWPNQQQSYQNQQPVYQDTSRHSEPNRPYTERQHHQPPRVGYRDYEYTESSGYGSESTHYTERSYNEQRFPDKGQYDSRLPPPPPNDNWPRSPIENVGRSPPRQSDGAGFRDRHRNDDIHSSSRAPQTYGKQDDFRQSERMPQDGYGPPTAAHRQSNYDNREPPGPPPPQETHYQHTDYGRDWGQPQRLQNYSSGNQWQTGHPPQGNQNPESGVVRPHVQSVRSARNMFEKQSDPRRPPPAPKPLIAPKPNAGPNVNTRPVPPRPRNLSGDWNHQPISQYHQSHPHGPKSPMSPQFDSRPQRYQQRTQPSHSQSMDNLDERSRYQSPQSTQRPPLHAQSLQNLDTRSGYPLDGNINQGEQGRDRERPEERYRNSYSGTAEERPMVLAVKYNRDTGPSLYTRQDAPKSQDSWERPPQEEKQPQDFNYRPRSQFSPTRPTNERSSWSREMNQNGPQMQSQEHIDRNAAPNVQSSYGPPRRQSNENENYVPDVVTRSYEIASQSQSLSPGFSRNDIQSFPKNHPQQQERNEGFTSKPVHSYRNTTENSTDRWPTPPPPIHETPPQHPMSPRERHQENNSYSDDWRRPGPPSHPSAPMQLGKKNAPPLRQSDYPASNLAQRYSSNQPPSLRIPPPPQQPYPYDSDSSEVDVDAPTPPPSNRHIKAPLATSNLRSESPYERNKPVPVNTKNPPPDSWRRLPYQPQNTREQTGQSDPTYSKRQPLMPMNLDQSHEVKSPPPLKPQRNSVHLSPQMKETQERSGSNEQDNFDFDVGTTQPLTHPSSITRQRLAKSGALAKRKPPSRQGSSSNLVDVGNEFQIEVTDSDLSQKATPIEVHREESMRILRTQKEKEASSSDTASSVLERSNKQRASQRVVPAPSVEKDEPTSSRSGAKKTDTKLVYKMPTGEAAKTVPMPQVTEPVTQATKRPPTYLGFGNTPEKPKTDLLSQFKSAKDSALRTAAEKQGRALKSVSALVKFSHGKKEPKSPPKPKLTAAERNAKALDKMNLEIKPKPEDEDDRNRHHHHRHDDERGDVKRSSTRSSSTIKPEKYDGDDDTTNGSRYDKRGRGRDRHRDDERGKSRGRSTSRGRDLSPEARGGRARHRSKSRERSLSPEDRRRPHKDYEDRRYNERRRYPDESSSHRRSHSPDRYHDDDRYHQRSPPHRHYPQPHDRHRPAREPDWVEQYRRGREGKSQQTRRAWVNDPRRMEVTVNGRRRELDMDAFEREVKKATSYNSDFEQPARRQQMIPTKLSSKRPPPSSRRQPPGDWMNQLKERNRSATRQRLLN